MPPPITLRTWPWVTVRIDCTMCARARAYRLVDLAIWYGADAEMERVLGAIVGRCPWWRPRARRYDPRCGARLTDLELATLPDLPAVAVRERIPPREAVPQRRVASPPAT